MPVAIILFPKFFFLIVLGIEALDNPQPAQAFIKYGDEVAKAVLYIR